MLDAFIAIWKRRTEKSSLLANLTLAAFVFPKEEDMQTHSHRRGKREKILACGPKGSIP